MRSRPKPNLNQLRESRDFNVIKNMGRPAAWALTLILLIGTAPSASGSSLTLGTVPGINHFNADNWLISGATVENVTPQSAAFESFQWSDSNNDGVWNGPDARSSAIGTYDNGLFGLYSLCQSLGEYKAAHQHVRTRGILVIDDVMVTTADPTPPATIPVSLNFHVSGEASHYNYVAQPDVIQSALNMSIQINGTTFNGEYKWLEDSGGISEIVTGLGTQIAGGAFSETFSATVTTGSANVPVNTPFTLRVEFVLTAVRGVGAGAHTAAWSSMPGTQPDSSRAPLSSTICRPVTRSIRRT